MSKRVYIVTPAFNSQAYIDRTIQSIAMQAGDFDLSYHIQDGGSSDATIKIVEHWFDLFESQILKTYCNSLKLTYSSTPDEGMYDAIDRGFKSLNPGPDGVLTWLNSDDELYPGSLSLVTGAFKRVPDLHWLTGSRSYIVNNARIDDQTRQRYPRKVIASGLCDGNNWDFIQQEGTFFDSFLWDKLEQTQRLPSFHLAGDWYTWFFFATYADLYSMNTSLAGFRRHDQQMSDKLRNQYLEEIEENLPQATRREFFYHLRNTNLTVKELEYKLTGELTGKDVDATRALAAKFIKTFPDSNVRFKDRFSDEVKTIQVKKWK
jgi:glycosyltransferase involved in cell wall biosynthesis